MKTIGDPIFSKDADGKLLSRIGTIFFRTPGLVTKRGVHAMQRLWWIEELNAAREKEEGAAEGQFTDLPELILIDGGPQQLRFARQAILDLGMEPPAMFGLAERLEEIWLPDAEEPILLDHRTPELQLVQRVRNEAHRFGIIHHRTLRGKASIHSQLEDIPGVGPARRKALLKAFGSLKAIRAADTETLAAVPGMNRAAAEAVRAWAEK